MYNVISKERTCDDSGYSESIRNGVRRFAQIILRLRKCVLWGSILLDQNIVKSRDEKHIRGPCRVLGSLREAVHLDTLRGILQARHRMYGLGSRVVAGWHIGERHFVPVCCRACDSVVGMWTAVIGRSVNEATAAVEHSSLCPWRQIT